MREVAWGTNDRKWPRWANGEPMMPVAASAFLQVSPVPDHAQN